jgi:Protein of unknown function (DUF3631)/CHC2 zinc finger
MRGNEQFEDWKTRARSVAIEREIERRGISLKRQSVAEFVGPCPKCGGTDRFSINTKKQVFNCRGCDAKGDVIALVEYLDGVDFVTACTTLVGPPLSKANGKHCASEPREIVVAEFPYHDEAGNIVFAVERHEFQNADGTFVMREGKRKKSFRQRRPDPDHPGKWIPNVDGVPVVPYRLPELLEAVAANHPILIVEGEAKVDLLQTWNVAATCNSSGAKHWKAEHSEFLRGADVVLCPDNNNVGWEHINIVGASLSGIAKRIRVLALPNLPPKGDVIDWAKAGGAREQLDTLINEARDWSPPIVDNPGKAAAMEREDELLEALAKLQPGLEFHRKRKEAAEELGVPEKAINAELKARREKAAPLHGHWIVEPWPEPADGDSLLRDIIRRIRRHVVCSYDDALSIALWIMFAWVHDEVATHSPILDITSAEPESGKSTTLGLVSFLAPRCISSVEITEAALFRAIALWQPSFCIDEFDSVLAGSDDKAALRSVINSGHTRGQGVVRCIDPDYRPEFFRTFCPKAIGMVGRKLPATTLSRCVVVELRRRKTGEPVEKFAHTDDGELANLRSRLARWSMDNADTLRSAKPSMPETFDNRRADNWRIMLAIADLAAEDWGSKARLAATKLEGASDTSTVGVRLLADIKHIFDQDGVACMLSAALVTRLKEDEEGPWIAWGRGKGLTQNSLAVLLGGGGGRGQGSRGGFGIHSQNVRPPNEPQSKGYKRSQFEDAWARYLPPENSSAPEGG